MLTYRGICVTKDEKLNKVVEDFSLLSEEKQNYILGILQALVFAGDEQEKTVRAETCREETDEIICG